MTKLRLQILVTAFLLICMKAAGQSGYPLLLNGVDRDSAFLAASVGIKTNFDSRNECISYINDLPATLIAKGYVTASLDSILYDSAFARIALYLGEQYQWAQLDAKQIDASILQSVGWREKIFTNKPMDFEQVKQWQEKVLNYLENNGYPFAKVYLDSMVIDSGSVRAQLKLDKGPSYKIDSIHIVGNAKIANEFLQRYLDIKNGSLFSKEKLLRISRRMRELTYVEEEYPSKLIWLGTGSTLEMYLKPKKSSQVNVLVGFLPNNDQLSSKKILITGEANLNLKNALGAGETIGLNWQQLQVKSPRLNILYQHPYLFNSPVGLDFSFDMFRKDSTFLNVNFQLGAQYILNINQAGKIFIQRTSTIVNGINKNFVTQYYRLPDEADVSAVSAGIDYEFNNTNYRLNPTKGNEFRIITAVGTKKIKKNNEILELKDPGNPSFDFGTLYDTVKLKTYQLRIKISAARYLPLGKQNRSTIKLAVNGGMFQSGNIFRNELFQIGGYKLLRGFDEESQYLSQFAVATAEYRYLVGQNSYFYAFTDGGWGGNNSQNADVDYTYFGTGLGLAFETKVGIFNLAWAVGKRSDLPFNLRQSKIHFGFVNYF
ncbi:POTRA domain-containing protein [Terrimonas pollutisoli]|uniref:POTRA domain-containing protein n=1 Tax=Terrimonas pollutisoli TaxID=3034147 RepID=UPI0023EC3192|nr:POTRA domain-containing protein [Terrimonas sp. H1YJ31]